LNRLEVSYLPTRNLDDGVYQVTVKAHDAYNTSSFIRYTFSVDQTPPTVSILPIAPLNPDTASAAIVVQTQSSDGVNIVIPKTVTTIRNAQNSTIYSATTGTTNTGIGLTSIVPTSSAFPDGMYTITVEMTDVAGNVGSVTQSVQIDRAPPRVIAMSGMGGVWTQTTPNAEFRITVNETVAAVIMIRNLAGDWVDGGSMVTTNMALNGQWGLRYQCSTAAWADGVYGVQIQLTDLAGNVSVVTGNITVDHTAPVLDAVSVSPLILSGQNGYVTELTTAISEPSGAVVAGQIVVKNSAGEVVATQGVTVGVGRRQQWHINGSMWPKGAYHIELVVRDSAGNVASNGMDVVKDGIRPTIFYPITNDIVSGIVSIKGQVMDPDFSNRYPMSKFRITVKQGDFALRTPADLAGFVENAAWAWVPNRLRSGSSMETQGTQEVRVPDTLGYFNPSAAGVQPNMPYTIAVAVEE
ncbi:hypothetical protein EBR57_09650, partial [bacterium]|nr:hypothetical protein [bacterium]